MARLVVSNPAGGVGGIEDRAVEGGPGDEVRGVLGHEAIARLALAQSHLRGPALGDVAVDTDRAHYPPHGVRHRGAANLHPDGRPIFSPHPHFILIGDTVLPQLAFRAKRGHIVVGVHQEVDVAPDQLLTRETDHLAEAAVDELQSAVGVDLGQAFAHALDQQAVTRLAAAQRTFHARALQGAGEYLTDHVQQRDVLLRPGVFLRDRVQPERAEKPATRGHRHGQCADVTAPAVGLELALRLRRQIGHAVREVDVVEAPQARERELELLHRLLLYVGRTRGNAFGAPFVRDGDGAARFIELRDEAAIGAEETADGGQGIDDRSIQLVGRNVDEARGDGRDELLELDAMLQ